LSAPNPKGYVFLATLGTTFLLHKFGEKEVTFGFLKFIAVTIVFREKHLNFITLSLL
jgi:hypothetical protein